MDNSFIISEIVEKKSNADSPLLVTFQNGELLQKSATKRNCKVEVDNAKQRKVEIHSANGHTFSGCEDTKRGCRLFCIVRKNGSSEAKMTEIGTVTLMNKKYSETSEAVHAPEAIEARTAALSRSFAGKRQQRRMDQMAKLKLDSSAVQTSLNDSVKAIQPKVEASSMSVQIQESFLDVLPPCHRDVTDVSQVFILEELFGEDLVGECVSKMDELLDSKPNDYIESFPPFVRAMWNGAASSKVNREVKAFASILVDSLHRFVETKAKDLRREHMFCPYQPVNSRIMEMFTVTTPEGLCRSNRMKDKALCYVLALSFIANDYVIKISELASLMNVSTKKLSDLCRAVGGTEVDKVKGLGIFSMKLPLPEMPTLLFQRRKNKPKK